MIKEHKHGNQVIVTGASGFVGRHLVPLLLANKYHVIALGRDVLKAKKCNWFDDVEFISFDIEKDIFSHSINPEATLIHLAWDGLPNYESLSHFERNLPASYQFIKSILKKGVRKVLIAGTCFEYGFQCGPLHSDLRPHPNTPYGFAKDCLRSSLEYYASKHPFTLQWARLFFMYGNGQSKNSLFSQLESAIDNNLEIFHMSGGEQLRDYLPIESVANQLFELFQSDKPGIFNVCSGNPISVRRFVENVIADRGSSIKLNLGYYPYPAYEPMAFWGVPDIIETIYLPCIPNSPLKNICEEQSLGPLRLRRNSELLFVENEAFDPDLITYDENYENCQSYSLKFKEHMISVLNLLKTLLPKGSTLVEVGCGKGSFVDLVQTDGYFEIRGFDSSYNGSNPAIEKRYLTSEDRITADLIVLRHVLEHIHNPYNFLSMLKVVFGSAKIYIEVPNFDWIVSNNAFFDITYEHVNYFTQHSLKSLFYSSGSTTGLLFDDQYQYVISDISWLNPNFHKLYNFGSWTLLSLDQMFSSMNTKIQYLDQLANNRSVFLWGAGTKGAIFLAHCARQNTLIDKIKFVIDINPNKIGKYLPGAKIKIRSKDEFFSTVVPGDVLLISNPAYNDEILLEISAAGLSGIVVCTL